MGVTLQGIWVSWLLFPPLEERDVKNHHLTLQAVSGAHRASTVLLDSKSNASKAALIFLWTSDTMASDKRERKHKQLVTEAVTPPSVRSSK